jgi:hypothetical protein
MAKSPTFTSQWKPIAMVISAHADSLLSHSIGKKMPMMLLMEWMTQIYKAAKLRSTKQNQGSLVRVAPAQLFQGAGASFVATMSGAHAIVVMRVVLRMVRKPAAAVVRIGVVAVAGVGGAIAGADTFSCVTEAAEQNTNLSENVARCHL